MSQTGRLVTDEPIISSQWVEFVRFCARLKFGEIERLKIQDGVPVCAEIVKEKVKFS